MSKLVKITQDLFNSLNYDMESTNGTTKSKLETPPSPSALIIFGNSDLNAAIYHLSRSLNSLDNTVNTVLVQESIKQDFVQKLQSQLKPYPDDISNNKNFIKALETIQKLNAEVITVPGHVGVAPTLVCDFTHEQFGNQLTGVVTLHTFRTAKEAISLIGKETLKFSNLFIWNENHGCAFELVAALKSPNFYINCFYIPPGLLANSTSQGTSFVVMDKNYHYETVLHDGVQKSIVFPIGSIFAN